MKSVASAKVTTKAAKDADTISKPKTNRKILSNGKYDDQFSDSDEKSSESGDDLIDSLNPLELGGKLNNARKSLGDVTKIGDGIGNLGKGLGEGLGKMKDMNLSKVGDGIGSLGKGAVSGLGSLGKGAVSGLGDLGKGAVSGIGTLGKGLGDGIGTLGKGLGDGFG